MPHDASALMELGARLNGLAGEGVKPWHLKASYTVLDEQGKAKEQGTFEEFWVGPRRNRITYTVGAESETIYTTDDGSLRAGILSEPSSLAQEVDLEFVRPLPALAYIEHQSFEKHTQKVGEAKVECVEEKPVSGFQHMGPSLNMYCFNQDKPILRIDVSAAGRKQAIRNAIVVFEGKYIPKDIRLTESDKTSISAHLESLELISHVVDADFTPPADAKPLPRRVSISSGVAAGLLLKQVPPHYPDKANMARVSGTVSIRVRIGTDGLVHNPEIVSGPPMLQQAALEAVKGWAYRPYLLNGEAIEVDTQVNIIFNLAP